MATNTLLQRLDPAADTAGSSVGASHRRQVEDFLAGGAITAGAWVSLDYDKTGADRALYVRVEDTSGGAVAAGVPAVGVALGAAAAGDRVRVVVAGYVEAAQVAVVAALAEAAVQVAVAAGLLGEAVARAPVSADQVAVVAALRAPDQRITAHRGAARRLAAAAPAGLGDARGVAAVAQAEVAIVAALVPPHEGITADAVKVGAVPGGFEALLAEQTPGGINERNTHDMAEAGAFRALQAALDYTLVKMSGG